jgi:hypothetical protein
MSLYKHPLSTVAAELYSLYKRVIPVKKINGGDYTSPSHLPGGCDEVYICPDQLCDTIIMIYFADLFASVSQW